MELKNRKDMDPRFTWDFTDIFESDEAFEAALGEASAAVAEISSVKGSLMESAESLKRGLDLIYGAAEKVVRVYSYASLHKSADNGDPAYQEMKDAP